MHNLHLILVTADSAEQAALIAEAELRGEGIDTGCLVIGGIASENGKDDVNALDQAAKWHLSHVANQEGDTPFRRCASLVNNEVASENNLLCLSLVKDDRPIPQFRDWDFFELGLTDLSGLYDGEQRYICMLDMARR